MSDEVKHKNCVSELWEMELVMQWSSNNVQEIGKNKRFWWVKTDKHREGCIGLYYSANLFDALYEAWVKRDE